MSRQSSVYRFSNPSSSIRRQHHINQDNFPLLDYKEIAICLQSCDFFANEELVLKPTSQYIKVLFEQILDSFLGVTNENINRKVSVLKSSSFNQDNESTMNEDDDDDDVKNSLSIVLMHKVLYQFLSDCGIDDFTLMDIYKPEPQRIRRILSAVVNFARFREEHSVDCDELLNLSEKNLESMRKIQSENLKITEEIKNLKLKLNSNNRSNIDQVNLYNSKIESDLKKLKKTQGQLTSERLSYKNEKTILIKKLEDLTYLLSEEKKNLDKIKFYLVEKPEIIIEINKDLQTKLNHDLKQLNECDQRIRNYVLSIESFQLLEQDLKNLSRILNDIMNQLEDGDSTMDKLSKFQEILDQKEMESDDLDKEIEQLARKLKTNEEKIERTRKQSENKRLEYKAKMEELGKTFTELSSQRKSREQEINKKKRQIDMLERKMKELNSNFQREVSETNLEISKLNSHLNLYLNEMEKKCNI